MSESRTGILDISGATQDDSMDLLSMIQQPEVATPDAVEKKETSNATPPDAATSDQATAVPFPHTGSALAAAKLAKERGAGVGMEVNPNAVIENARPKELKNYAMNDDRMASIEAWKTDMDNTLEKRKHIIVTKVPKTAQEYIAMMDEIDSIAVDENGTPYYNVMEDKEVEVPGENGLVEIKHEAVRVKDFTPKYTRIRTVNDPEFSMEGDKKFLDVMSNSMNGDPLYSDDTNADSIADGVVDKGVVKNAEIDRQKGALIKVIIDKTQTGAPINFTDEEHAKLTEASEIQLTEVKKITLSSLRVRKKDKTLKEAIEAQNASGGGSTTICFPGSGFRAQMSPLSYGELGDIALQMESVTFNIYWKRLSVIYNKMKNISCGAFNSFDEFLKSFAYTDISMALYGLYVATFPDSNSLEMRCNVNTCNRTFSHTFSTRNVIQLDKCNLTFLNKMKEIASCPPNGLKFMAENSAVRNPKRFELPESKVIVEIGIASAYDFLYNLVPIMDENTFRNEFGEDENDTYKKLMLYLTTVTKLFVPVEGGEYYECTGYKDIIDGLYMVTPQENKILTSIINKYLEEYTPVFELVGVTCPHCGHANRPIAISMDELVFQTHQTLESTEIDESSIPNL